MYWTLVLTEPVAPVFWWKLRVPEIGKEKQTGSANNPILRIFLMLAALLQYIGAR
jgi:hypothetical protein